MEIIRHPEAVPDALKGAVIALGNFDGFHRGHQAVVGAARRIAREAGAPLALFTTEPHPRSFFRPEDPPFRLTPFRERAHLFEAFGVDLLLCMTFDLALSRHSPEAFVASILVGHLAATHVVTGFDYRFGKGRAGDADLLRKLGDIHGFAVTSIAPVTTGDAGGEPVIYSSSVIRETLQKGDVRQAAELLGHWWTISGRVIEGDRRGRTIGFPTANVELGDSIHPLHGVYAVRVEIEGETTIFDAVANIGRRPTFDKRDVLLEVHIPGFDGDIYGRHLRVEFVAFLRGERKFDGLEALKAQIGADTGAALATLRDPAHARARLTLPH